MGITMADQISLGKNGNIGKLDLSRIKAGIKKEELAKNDPRLESVFDIVDKNKDGVLDREELDNLQKTLGNLAGEDGILEKKEVKNFDGQKLGRKDRKALLEFLNKLDGVTPENVEKVETKLVEEKLVEVVTYKDGHTEEYYPNGQKISEVVQGNKKTKTTEMNGTVTSEVVTENEGEENEIISTTSIVDGKKQTVINNIGDKTTTTINYNGDKKSDATIKGENSKTVITYDAEGNPAKEVETTGTTEKTYIYQNGQKVLQSVIENKGLECKETTKVYDSEGGYTQTQKVPNGKITTVVDKDGNVTSNVKTETVNGQELSLQLDKDGNIPGIIVQNGESPAAIAKKFGCSVDELMQLNADQLKGKGKNQYFDVGSEIKLPGSVSVEKFNKASEGRKPAEIAKQEYARDAEIRRQKAEAAQAQNKLREAQLKKLGLKDTKGAGETVIAHTQKQSNIKLKKIGNAGFGRSICETQNGKFYLVSHDGVILKEEYVQAHKAFVNKPKEQRNNTASGLKDVTYVKDEKGNIWYFDEKTGKAIVKDDYKQVVKQESTFVANQLHTAAKGLGTDNELLEKGIENIYSRDILQGVNAELRTKDSDYNVDTQKTQMMPVEALILDENNHKSARPLLKTLVNSGAMTTQEQARTIKREMEYELAGESGGILTQGKRALEHFEFGTSYTSTADLNEIMQMTSDRNVRLEIENQYKNDPQFAGLKPDKEGSYVRARIGVDGWNKQEVNQFDANWIKTGAYQEAGYVYKKDEKGNKVFDENGQPVMEWDKGDQDHRDKVAYKLIFYYKNKEALNKGLDAINDDENSKDQQHFLKMAAKEVETDPNGKYQERFTGQDPRQRFIAGFHSDAAGNVDAGNVSASNTCLFKGIKPARVQAEEALYNAKNGNYSQTFDSTEPETYTAMAEIVANGDIEGVEDMTDLYNKALESTKNSTKQQLVKGNAILSGQIDFTDEQIANYCVELMHNIDKNRGTAASSNTNSKSMTNGLGGYTNLADAQTEQLKAILQANPQIIQSVKQQVENGKFESVSHVTAGIQTKSFAEDTKEKYLNLIADTKSIVKEEVFLDANGKKITDKAQIKAIKAANMQSLQQMRQYVAELERDFKKGVDAEGTLSDMANGVLEASGWGTDRGDVANEYKQAKLMLNQFEAAAQGKLRDSDGNVISAQDLAQQMLDKQNALAETNSDYKQSVAFAKIGMVMAPVIVATAGAGAAVGALGAGTMTVAVASGTAAGATTYGMNALEYNTSYTGNTAEAREQNLQDSLVNGVTTAIGVGQGAKISQLAKNMNKAAQITTEIGANVAGDVVVDVATQAATTGDVSIDASNILSSVVGNAIGAKTSSKVATVPKDKTPTLTKATSHKPSANAPAEIAPNSSVNLRTDKSKAAISQEVDDVVATSTSGSEVAGVHNKLDGIGNRDVRRPNQRKLEEKAKTLSPEERAKYEQSVREHHQAQTEHTFGRHNELSEADFRTIGNSVKDAKTPADLVNLRKGLKQKEYTHGGVTAEYKALEDQIDNKLTNMIRNADADDLDKISKQLTEMKSQVQNDARLNSSIEKLNNEVTTRKAFLQDQKGAVEGMLKNGKGIADDNELNKITSYIKTLDSKEMLDNAEVLIRNKKMTGAQKKIIDNAMKEQKARFGEVVGNTKTSPAKLTQQNLEQFENLNYQETYNQLRDRGIKVKTQRPDGAKRGILVFEDGGKKYTFKFDQDGNFTGRGSVDIIPPEHAIQKAPTPEPPKANEIHAPAPEPEVKVEAETPAPTPEPPKANEIHAPAPEAEVKVETETPAPKANEEASVVGHAGDETPNVDIQKSKDAAIIHKEEVETLAKPDVNSEPKPTETPAKPDSKISTLNYNYKNVKYGGSGMSDLDGLNPATVRTLKKGEIKIIHENGKTFILKGSTQGSSAGWRVGDHKGFSFEGEIPDEICQKFLKDFDWDNVKSMGEVAQRMNDCINNTKKLSARGGIEVSTLEAETPASKPNVDTPAPKAEPKKTISYTQEQLNQTMKENGFTEGGVIMGDGATYTYRNPSTGEEITIKINKDGQVLERTLNKPSKAPETPAPTSEPSKAPEAQSHVASGGGKGIKPKNQFKPFTTAEEANKFYNSVIEDRTISSRNPKSSQILKDGKSYFTDISGYRYEIHNPSGTGNIRQDYNAMKSKRQTKWKMHIYADNPQEWGNAAQIAMPYLRENKIMYKTYDNLDPSTFEWQRNPKNMNGVQQGKAFTLYFENEEQFVQTAQALESRFKEAGIFSSGQVKNEAQIGESGFLSYRHEGAERGVVYKPDNVVDPLENLKTRSGGGYRGF